MLNVYLANVYKYDSWLQGVLDNQLNDPVFVAGAIAAGVGLLGVILFRKWLRVASLVLLLAAVCVVAYSC